MTEVTKTTRKPRATRTVKTETPETKKVEVVETTVVKEVDIQEKRELKDDDNIILLNNVHGRYVYNPKNGMPFRMVEYGDEVEITFKQLKDMYRSDRNHLTKGYVYIDNEYAVEALNLQKVYEYMYNQYEVQELLDKGDNLENILNNMPEVMKETFLSVAYHSAKNGTLSNLNVVRTIKNVTGVDITINTTFQDWN